MQLLTDIGYKHIDDCVIGDKLIAYDINDGHVIINELEKKQWFSPDMFEDLYSQPEQVVMDGVPQYEQVPMIDENGDYLFDEEGNQLFQDGDPIMTTPVLVKTKEQIFEETYGELKFYKINNTWTLFKNQSVWANLRVTHASDLQIGDVIYDDEDHDIIITSIEEVAVDGWWRLTVSGDHSYIADNLTLHNASRYWVGGGASANWNATANTNWGSASGLQDNSSVPASTDDVTFDGAGTAGNTSSTISAAITILLLNITSGYTATMTHNAALTVAGNVTLGANYTIAGTTALTVSAASTITSNGKTWINDLIFDGANTKTLVGNLSVTGKLFVQPSSATVINRTTTETLSISGGANFASYVSGTATLVYKGGTFTGTSYNTLSNSVTFDGNITIGNLYGFGGGTLKYLSGTVTFVSGIYFNNNITVDTVGMSWGGVFSNGGTYTLLSNFSAVTLGQNGNSFWNTSNGSTVTVSSQLWSQGGTGGFNGTAKFFLTGGTIYTTQTYFYLAIDVTLNGNVTIGEAGSGRICGFAGGAIRYQSGTITTTSSTLHFYGGTTILDTNGVTWNNITSSNPSTITLSSNLLMTGLLTVSSATTINQTTTQTWTVGGGMTVNAALGGTASIYLTGGTWSHSGFGTYVSNNLFLNGNITISTVWYSTNTLKYLSGTINANSNFNINGGTLDIEGVTLFFILTRGGTINLLSNVVCNTLSIQTTNVTINTSLSKTITATAGLTVASPISGTAKIILTGGTWSGSSSLANSLDLNGNVTISGSVSYGGGTLTYVSGTVVTTGSTLNLVNYCALDTRSIRFNNVSSNIGYNGSFYVTLFSDLYIDGFLSLTSGGGTSTVRYNLKFNQNTSEVIYLNGGLFISGSGQTGQPFSGDAALSGAPIYLTGGTWSASGGGAALNNNLILRGNVTISGNVYYNGGVLTYERGVINSSTAILNIINYATVINFNKVPLKGVNIVSYVILNNFFTGTPSQLCQVSGTSYTINFTDNFERIARNVAISGATLARPGQLIVATNSRFNTNRITNSHGIRYINQSPNGIMPFIQNATDTMAFPAMGLASDPCFQRQG